MWNIKGWFYQKILPNDTQISFLKISTKIRKNLTPDYTTVSGFGFFEPFCDVTGQNATFPNFDAIDDFDDRFLKIY